LIKGIFASLAALMFNCVRKEDIDYSPYDEGEWRYSIHRISQFMFSLALWLMSQLSINISNNCVWNVDVLVSGLCLCLYYVLCMCPN